VLKNPNNTRRLRLHQQAETFQKSLRDVDLQCADCCCDVPTAEIDLTQTKQKPVGIGGGGRGGGNCTLTCDGIDPS
jgi:hypothetical protein